MQEENEVPTRVVELPETMLDRVEEVMEEDWVGWESLQEYVRAALREFNLERRRSIHTAGL